MNDYTVSCHEVGWRGGPLMLQWLTCRSTFLPVNIKPCDKKVQHCQHNDLDHIHTNVVDSLRWRSAPTGGILAIVFLQWCSHLLSAWIIVIQFLQSQVYSYMEQNFVELQYEYAAIMQMAWRLEPPHIWSWEWSCRTITWTDRNGTSYCGRSQ